MGTERIELPAVGLEPTILPLNYAPLSFLRKSVFLMFSF